MANTSEGNSLGLEFNNLSIKDETAAAETTEKKEATAEATPTATTTESAEEPETPVSPGGKESKKKPYVNPDRFKTGGTQRDKLTEEELAERMERIRQQNEKIKQRRLDVQADEDAFRKTQQEEKVKQAKTRKVQESVDKAREQNAKRKMDKVQSREWDSGKPSGDWKGKKTDGPDAEESQSPQRESGGWSRGGRGGGRGRGGGGGGRGTGRKRDSDASKPSDAAATETTATTAPASQATEAGNEAKA
ncbi:hypothetical protein AAF712_012109 [Marasmius tenuissimus]|uniref:Uncharacterized protein n=1 Tax=Marasmius tenuissimus TaxID=585030 RepID=A0ABR2ZIR4_9AGAR|nr:hypothetical protein PM082_012731 [Marasmius tenuissimus]